MQRSIIAALLFGVLAAALPQAAPAETATLTVTGQGRATAAPDIATIRAGVETEGATAAEALAANSALAASIIATLKETGVAPRDIQTSGLYVEPLYEQPAPGQQRQAPRIAGYRVVNEVAVTIRDIGAMGAALDRLVAAGANRINSLGFGLADDRPLADAARREAVADARRAASALAEAAGVKLVRILSVADGGGGGPGPMPGIQFRAEAMAVPVEAGETTVRASVTVVWEIAPAG